MRNRQWLRIVCCLLFIAAVGLTGCKKKVAVATPAPPPVQPPPPPAPTITLRATPGSIDRGESTSLQWEAKNATSVRIVPDVGDVQNQGSRSVNPTSSVTYTATATGPGGSAADSARITVRVPAAAAPAPAPPRAEARLSEEELFKQNVRMI